MMSQRLPLQSLFAPTLDELDMNPLVVFEKGKGAGVFDARIFLSTKSEGTTAGPTCARDGGKL